MRIFLLVAIVAMTGVAATRIIRHISSEEKKILAVECSFLTPYEEPGLPPPPPPCVSLPYPDLYSAHIESISVSCCCGIEPPIEKIEPAIEQVIEPVIIEPAPAPCVNRAYMNGNWMSHLWTYIKIDSIDHNQAPYNNYSVSFQYRVLPDGTVTDLIIEGDAFGAEKMLHKAFEESKLKWVPAIVDGQPVPSTFQQKIVFYPDNNTPVSIGEPQFLRFDSWL